MLSALTRAAKPVYRLLTCVDAKRVYAAIRPELRGLFGTVRVIIGSRPRLRAPGPLGPLLPPADRHRSARQGPANRRPAAHQSPETQRLRPTARYAKEGLSWGYLKPAPSPGRTHTGAADRLPQGRARPCRRPCPRASVPVLPRRPPAFARGATAVGAFRSLVQQQERCRLLATAWCSLRDGGLFPGKEATARSRADDTGAMPQAQRGVGPGGALSSTNDGYMPSPGTLRKASTSAPLVAWSASAVLPFTTGCARAERLKPPSPSDDPSMSLSAHL